MTFDRPPHGYALSLYDVLCRNVRDLPAEIAAHHADVVRRAEYVARLEDRLLRDRSTLAWMRLHQADEIAAVEAEREQKRAILRAAGWKV